MNGFDRVILAGVVADLEELIRLLGDDEMGIVRVKADIAAIRLLITREKQWPGRQ